MADVSTEVAIATQTLGSAASSITFNSIPSTYTDLRVVFIGQGNAANVDTLLRFNSDSGTNYSETDLTGSGSAANTFNRTSNTSIVASYPATWSAQPSLFTMDIFSYAGSTYKTVLNTLSGDQNGSGYVMRQVGLWRSTSEITSITLTTGGANTYTAGCIATLYGIL